MSAGYIVAAKRSAVAPRDGAFRDIEAADLASAVIRAVLAEARLAPADVDDCILGNALYGGGNLARVAALAAGVSERAPAMTIDTQCCAGLDAILLAAGRIASGDAHVVVAGGAESFSRAPIRMRRPKQPGESPQVYARPPFTPWADRDPDMIAAAAELAASVGITRARQEAFAIESHRKAIESSKNAAEIVEIAGLAHDSFTRPLSNVFCARLPVLAGDRMHGLTAATTAVEADAAAIVLVVSEKIAAQIHGARAVRVVAGLRRGGDPCMPGLAPIAAARELLNGSGLDAERIEVVELMEAFAAQAIACAEGVGLAQNRLNRGGGALARGHPIGASGAILTVRLWHELQKEKDGALGFATIAAAGGLASAVLLQAA